VVSLGALPNPMRYQPLDAVKKNSFVDENWTEQLLSDYMRYWSKLRYFGGFSFDDYKNLRHLKTDNQPVLPGL